MKIITINAANIDNEHICCAIGDDKTNRARAETKKKWMSDRFKEGLVFKRLDERGKIFIEYIPIEYAWKPLAGKNYMVINCLWVSGKFKGQGISTRLLNECINDAKAQRMNGVAVVTSGRVRPFLTDRNFFEKQGFVSVDKAEPYFELMVLKFNNEAADPAFTGRAKAGTCDNKNGFTIIYSNQCVFMEEYAAIFAEKVKEMKLPVKLVKLANSNEAKQMGSPFGTLGIYYEGKFVTHELMTAGKFGKLIEKLVSQN